MATADPGSTDALSTETNSLGRRIAVEQLKIAFGSLPNSFAAIPILVVVVTLLELTEPPLPVYWVQWSLIAVIVSAVRYYFYRGFKKVKDSPFDYQFWAKRYSFGIMIAGLFWGTTPFVLFRDNSFEHKIFISLLIAGLATGVSYAYSSFLRPARFYMTFSLVPLVVAILLERTAVSYAVASIIGFYYVILMKWLKDNNRFGYEGIKTALEKGDFAEKLASVSEKAEADNRLLRAEVERRRFVEERLEEEQERFKMLTEVAEEGIFLSADGILLDCNEQYAKLLGYDKPEEVKGRRILDAIAPEMRDFVRDVLQKNSDRRYEAVLVRRDGSPRTFEAVGKQITYKGQKVRITSVSDITDRKKMENDLKKAKAAAEEATILKDKFVGLVAHDLRSPFTTILGYLQMLKADETTPLAPSQKEMVERVTQTSHNTLKMVNDLLNISRLQSGKMVLHPRFVSARHLADHALAAHSSHAEKKGVRLEDELPADLLLYGDVPLLQELFNNLASNAIKFCGKGGVVRFHSPSAEEGVVAITDTGIGIEKKMLPDLFRHEVKTSTYGTAEEPGSGFGLPLCGDIVRTHGGSISAESEPGRGSTLTVRLPKVRPSVLIVDDDLQSRSMAAGLLAPLRCEVREAAGGAEAMESIRSSPPHVIISDLQMPEMDGYGLLAELQKDAGLRKIPVILMTGLGVEERTRAFDHGASDFIAKPIDAADLLPRVRRFLGG
ncbi:MAG: response regulator [Nitrospinae bacterium]|nr:response regulator [Nitrospinota bacterium]